MISAANVVFYNFSPLTFFQETNSLGGQTKTELTTQSQGTKIEHSKQFFSTATQEFVSWKSVKC